MHVFSSHSSKVYKDQPATCILEPPTRRWYSTESGDKEARCSSVMALLARPMNQAPTMYAAPVSSPYTTYGSSATKHYQQEATYTRQQHQIIICLEIPRPDHNPSCRGSQSNEQDGHAQQCKCLRDEVTHDEVKGKGALCFFLPAKERTFDSLAGERESKRRSPAARPASSRGKKTKEVTGW